ncbi:PAS domain-containing protein [Janthinobacterium fluminis]|uniref:histidine kinase n=1 Tax=Janthinobacterium fluminis TaxID=2987524 RepID=A0ABT5JY36_9BURK|nr:PAS domain-containing protein [Janthinobacterium fluminis]MDC8756956.1 PAS domain-containing protein [Janthinobacterium fluminis]
MHANKIISLLDAEHAAGASIAAGATLAHALAQIIQAVEAQSDDVVHACILSLDAADRFTALVAPSLAADYAPALLRSSIGPRTSPFGAAAFSGAPVFSSDIAQDQTWTDGRKDALLHGLRACWAAPVFGAKGHILGVLGLMFATPKHPTQVETALLNVAARACAHTIERRQAAEAIAESEAEFRALAEAMPNQAWLARQDGTVYWANQRGYEYTGAVPGRHVADDWRKIVHADDLPGAVDAWRAAIAGGIVYEQEFRLRCGADGSYRRFLVRAVPVRDRNGAVLRWVGINTDIQEQKNAAEKLAYLNFSLEIEVANRTADRDRMWQLSTDIMLVADFSGMIIAVNPAWSSILARKEGESLGMDFLELVHADDRADTLREFGKLEEGVPTLRFENRYLHCDGSYRWISWTAAGSQELIHAIGRDITDEKEARLALARSEQALLQSQKLESIGKLTGGVAHDFNNVLQIISGNLQLLQLAVGDNAVAMRRVETSISAVERGAKLSSQLLAFARRQPLKPLVTDLGRLVRSTAELFRRAIGDMIETEIIVGAALWHALIDPNQLENVLLNMAINARDAMQRQGKLTLELGNVTLAADARQPEVLPGQYVRLAVTDTGHGMEQDILDKIFEPFFSTKKEGEGTGLGLSMAYGFIKQSGGHIKVHSRAGQGSTFEIYLPRTLEPLADMRVALSGPVLGGSETILVVEDDVHVQTAVVDMLRGLGYTVLKANTAMSALTVVKSGVPIDLLFTDVVMPGELRSPEMVRQAKLLLPQLQVLFTSGYTQNAIMHGGRLEPGVELLSKPYRREDLARKVHELLLRRHAGQQT